MIAVTGLVGVALAGCSDNGDGRASPSPTSTIAVTTSSSAPPPTTATTVVVTTTTGAPTATTTAASSPEGHARALYEAWSSGDPAAAERVAQPEAVATLFARPWQAGDGWTFAECSGAAGSVICAWERPSGQQVLFRVRNVVPVTVSEVRFQP